MNMHYDNHANQIDYFNLHKPNIEVKKKVKIDLNDLSDLELTEKLDDVEDRIEELTELYNNTKHEGTHQALAKLCTFRHVIRKQVRIRKLETNQSLRQKIAELEKENESVVQPVISNDSKEVEKLKTNNKSLKGEVNAWREKYNQSIKDENKKLIKELTEVRAVLAENREVEKTKRHALSVKNDKFACAYLLEFVKNTVSEKEYQEVLDDLKEIRAKGDAV